MQLQLSSIGFMSFAKAAFFNLIAPESTRATPKRAVRVGYTESYMSAPRAEQTRTSKGYPIPITYRGLPEAPTDSNRRRLQDEAPFVRLLISANVQMVK
jgi:hypothetical protein